MPTTIRAAALGAALCLIALPAAAALYKWVDANGRTVYSDQPPNANVKVETVNGPPPPGNPNAAKELAQKDAELKKRQSDRAAVTAKAEKERAATEKRAEECTRVASALQQLSWGQVVIYRANEKGEQVPMDDAARAKERARLEAWQKENC
ncbi:MAG TPA: DUF4124 domain-containing protein [Casimicrobiaceae bacterium]|jgi:Skp family chaperone for outer membrane proteins|nr:DUF4124 domain-containing protein [Casimicrobiaceae bacterium]